MTGAAELAAAGIASLHPILALFQSYLAIGSYLCPTSSTIHTIANTHFDYVIAGAGTAGSIIAYRLSECPHVNVLVLEEGDCPPIESILPGYFPLTPKSGIDRAMNLQNDGYTSQYQQPDAGVTAGKMLGGTGSLDHMIRMWPELEDLHCWCQAAGEASWCGEAMLEYFRKSENVVDPGIIGQNTARHGQSGPMKCARQQSCANDFMKDAYMEMGYPFLNDKLGQCATEPLLTVADGLRQNGNVGFLSKMTNRPNVQFLTGARVEKILFDGVTATGLQFNYNGYSYSVAAKNKVIISAGAIVSPQLLMLSGVGNAATLAEMGINTVVDNPQVGLNLRDHVAGVMGIVLDRDTRPIPPADPHLWPTAMTTWFLADNPRQSYPDMLAINVLFDHDSSGFIQLCIYGFKYTAEICNRLAASNVGRRLLFMVYNYLHPVSTGSISLNTTNIADQPIINLGLLSNSADLGNLAVLAKKVGAILNTSAFRKLGAEFVDLGVCSEYIKFSDEFWKCYVLALSSTGWHYIGSCSLGRVVDAALNVYGTRNLKVIDASVIPSLPSAKISASVTAVAEKGADIIKIEDGLSCYA